MKKFIALVLSLASLSVFANGRCQYPNSSEWADCRPPVPVLVYHHVNSAIEPGETSITPQTLASQLDYIKAEGWTTITMSQLADFLARTKQIPLKSIVLTFDDGWRDQLIAANLMQERKQTATFFVLSGVFDNKNYMTRDEIAILARTFEVGAHTHTHFMAWAADLTKIDTATAIGEAVMSKVIIENTIGKPVVSLAWPYGYFTDEVMNYIKHTGFTSVATLQEWNGPHRRTGKPTLNPMDVQRLNIDGRCSLEVFIEMVNTGKQRTCK